MTISEFQAVLQEMKAKHGDMPMTMYSWQDPACPELVGGAEILAVRAHYPDDGPTEVYVRDDCLLNGGWGGGPKFLEPHQKRVLSKPVKNVLHIY